MKTSQSAVHVFSLVTAALLQEIFGKNKRITVLAGFNESSRFNESVFDLNVNIFLLHKNFGFREYQGLVNNWLGPERFVKSADHCIYFSFWIHFTVISLLNGPFLCSQAHISISFAWENGHPALMAKKYWTKGGYLSGRAVLGSFTHAERSA